MTTAGRRESGRGAVLTGFRILSPLMLEDGKDVFFELTASPVSGRDDLRLELFASEDSGSAGSWKRIAQATAAALDDLGLLNGRTTGGSAQFFVSDVPYEFARPARMFLGEYAGSGDVPVERIAIESY